MQHDSEKILQSPFLQPPPVTGKEEADRHSAPSPDALATASTAASAHQPAAAADNQAVLGALGHWSDARVGALPTPAPTGKDGEAAGEPKAAAPLGANERILSSDPKFATEAYIGWFREHVKAKVSAWELPFEPANIKLEKLALDGKPTPAVVLCWDAAWGAAPLTQEIPLSMAPIDARASVAGVKQLKGWSKVAAGDQGRLENLLGGETNQLSLASRGHLRGQYKGLVSKSDADQAKALEAELNVKEAMPGWAQESGAAKPTKFEVAGPAEKKDYAFTGKKADAEEWTAKYEDGVQFPIVAPKAPTDGFHGHTVHETADAASYMPKSARAVIKIVMLNPVTNPSDPDWAVKYKRPNFHSYMTAGADGIVTIYPDKSANPLPGAVSMRNAMIHETGHTWSKKLWGEDTTKGKWQDWQKAMDDDKVSVSGYATSAISEDVAETVRVYQVTKGKPAFQEYEKIVPHRFKMLQKEYK